MPLRSFVVLCITACTTAAVFRRGGSANDTGEIDLSSSLAASYSRVLTQAIKPRIPTSLL